MHGLWRVREHMPEAGDHHAAGRGGISVSEGGRGKVRFLRLVRKALSGGAGNAGTPRASVRRAGQGRGASGAVILRRRVHAACARGDSAGRRGVRRGV